MNLRYLVSLLLCIGLMLTGALSCKKKAVEEEQAPTDFDRKAMLRDIADNIIMPGNKAFAEEAAALSVQLNQLGGNLGVADIEAAQAQWRKTANAWKLCELFNIGAVRDAYIHNRIYTWPVNETFIYQYINGSDPLDEAFVASKGSSSKGLAAIELLLFDDAGSAAVADSLTNAADAIGKLAYLKALGQNLRSVSAELNDLWAVNSRNYYTTFVDAGGTGLTSSTGMLVNEMAALLEKMLNTKLAKPMGKQSGNMPDRTLLEAFRSRESLELLKSNLAVLEFTFHGGPGKTSVGIDDYLDAVNAQYDDKKLSEKIDAQFAVVRAAYDKLSPSLTNALANDIPAMETAYTETRTLLVLFKVDMVSKLGITLTLNDNDGD